MNSLNQGNPIDQENADQLEQNNPVAQGSQANQDGQASQDDLISQTSKSRNRINAAIETGKRLIEQLTPTKRSPQKKRSKLARYIELMETSSLEMAAYNDYQPERLPEEPLSTLFERQGLAIPIETFALYEQAMSNINLQTAAPDQLEFVKDYIETLAEIHKQRICRPKALEIDHALWKLPTAMNNSCTIKLNELVIRPAVFDGQNPKPRRWIQDFSEAVLANGWTDAIAVKYFPTFLTKAAKDWFFIDIKPQLQPETKFIELHKAFVVNFVNQYEKDDLSRVIENAKQRPGESVSTFFPRMRRLLLLQTPGISEREQVRQLKNKLRPEYKQLVSFKDPESLDELRSVCLRIEGGLAQRPSFERQTRLRYQWGQRNESPGERESANEADERQEAQEMPGPSSPTPMQQNDRTEKYPITPGSKMIWNDPFRHKQPESQARELICYNCGKAGHFARDCWSQGEMDENGEGYKLGNRGNINFVHEDDFGSSEFQMHEYGYESEGERREFEEPMMSSSTNGRNRMARPRFVVREIQHDNW